ncbi:YCF48-related protein [Flavobacterium caeni]|uniref:Por secretion system C-terminal sorting domain-containing protein n=1 Tax=Flavobacterium caeni TaxID=490189 RepID=A0A1G5FS92_9FLAO|nr:YCF48-related protein [Flavobacterium caeni]SCY42014.1 Por secretion system C-terminal sorting domain-containing protein [Flavobacterium caeni]
MRKFSFLMLLAVCSLSAQPEWHALESAPENTNNQRFDDVFFLTETLGWAANGSAAAVYKTTDGGENWTLQVAEQTPQLPGNYYFRNIEFLNENIGFLGTLQNNKFLKTTDGGATWSIIPSLMPTPAAICGIDCVGESTVYACGSYFSENAYVLKSTDSGQTWQYIDMGAYAEGLVELLFVDENLGYASGKGAAGGTILRTTDGGVSWTEIYNTGIAGEYVWKLQILASNPNCMFGSVESVNALPGKLVRTLDNGVSWVSHDVPDTDIQAVGFLTEDHGFMGGHASPFLETTDGGATWSENFVGSNLNRIQILNDNLAYASGATIYKFSETLGKSDFKEKGRTPLKAAVTPNPVKDKMTVTIEFVDSDHLVLELYDISGRRVRELLRDEIPAAGKKSYTFDAPRASGGYFVNIHTDTGRQSVKFVK